MTKDEVEAMIEVAINEVKAEYQQTINELRDEIAALKGIQSAKVPLKSTPNDGISTPKSTLQIQNTEKEITNHIVTGSNTIEENNYRVDEGKATFNKVEGNDPDEIAPSNEIDQTGDVCDFNKKSNDEVDTFQPEDNPADDTINPNGMTTPDDEQIINPNGEVKQSQPDEEIKQSQATANNADQSLATPQMGKLSTNEREHAQNANKVANPVSGNVNLNPEERIKQLEALNLQNRNTPNVNPIELAEELGNLIINDDVVYQSRLYNRVIALGCYLVWYANDNIDTLNQIEGLLMGNHIQKYGTSHPAILCGFDGLRNELANPQTLETSNKADQSVANTKDEETYQPERQTRPETPR